MSPCFESLNQTLVSLLATPAARSRSDAACRDLRRRIDAEGGHLVKLMPQPLFFDRLEASAISHAAAQLVRIQTRIIHDLLAQLGREGFLDRFSVPENMRRFVNWDELCDPQCLVGRVDFLMSDRGYRFCEFNVDSSAAGAELFDIGGDYFRHLGSTPNETIRAPLADLADLLARNARRQGAARIVLFDWSAGGGSAGKGYFSFDRMRDYVAAATDIPVFIADERSFDPAWLSPEHAPDTLVFRACMIMDMDDEGAFLGRMLDAGCKVFSTFESEIRTDKAWFALYHDERIKFRLPEADQALIEAVIPHTLQVHTGNLVDLLDRKDRLIFKRCRSFGGAGTVIGATTDAKSLRETLLTGGLETWIAQEMVESRRISFPHEPGGAAEPHEMVFGLYVYGDRHNGVMVRGSTISKIVNVSSGLAGAGWALCVDPMDRMRMESEIARHVHHQVRQSQDAL